MTKTTQPITPPIRASFRWNDQWVAVEVLNCITISGGTVRNTIRLPNGREIEVDNTRLKF